MKKVLTLLAFVAITITSYAYNCVIDGIYYNFSGNNSLTVTNDGTTNGYAYRGDVVIPEKVTYNGSEYKVIGIGQDAFANSGYRLTSVTIPNTVTYIDKHAFNKCTALTSIEIPNSVTRMEMYVFYGCSSLSSIKLSNSLETINYGLFYGCSDLKSITIPSSVTSIGREAFNGCYNLKEIYCEAKEVPEVYYETFNGFRKNLATLYVPATSLEAYKSATYFDGFGQILPIQKKVASISVKSSCPYLYSPSAYIGEKVTFTANVLPDDASNKTVSWSSSDSNVLSIDEGTGVAQVVGRGDVTVTATANDGSGVTGSCRISCLGSRDFDVRIDDICYNLNDNTNEATVTYSEFWYDDDYYYINELFPYSGSVVIPERICFKGKEYVVTKIGYSAFSECSELRSVTIPNTVKAIESGAFDDCSSFKIYCYATNVPVADGLKNVNLGYCTLYVPYSSLNAYKSTSPWSWFGTILPIAETVPPLVTSISISASSKMTIGETATLTATVLPENAADKTVTWSSSNPKVISINAETGEITACGKGKSTITATAVDGSGVSGSCEITSVGKSQYYDFDLNGLYYILNSETQEATVTSKSGGYSGDVSIPETFTLGSVEYKVTGIGKDAFYQCEDLTSISIPNTVKEIGERALFGCTSLGAIVIPNSVQTIGASAISKCGITSIDIPNSVTTIGDWAFAYNKGITSVVIPKSVTSFGVYVFYATSIESIVVEQGNPRYDSRDNCNAVIETSTNTLLTGCSQSTIPSTVTSIGDYAFQDCDLISVTIPNSVTSIGNSAFASNPNLTSIVIPNSVTSIDYAAFTSCRGLTSVEIPNSVTSIGDFAFNFCSGLTTLSIGSAVKTIGDYAFSNCTSLETVYCYAEELPSTKKPLFSSSSISTATLYVPEGSLEAYQSSAHWNGFSSILPIQPTEDPISPDNNLTAKPFSAHRGESANLTIGLENLAAITSVQFELTLPEGLTVDTDEFGYLYEYNAERVSSRNPHVLESELLSNGSIRFMSYSSAGIAYTGNTGDLIYLPISVDEEMAEGVYEIKISNIKLVVSSTEAYKCQDFVVTAEIKKNTNIYTPGDVNNDGGIDNQDVVGTVELALNRTTTAIPEAADINKDGSIDNQDVVGVVALALNRPLHAPAKAKQNITEVPMNGLKIASVYADKDSEEAMLSVSLNNETQFTAVQFDLYLPEGVTPLQDEYGYYLELNGSRCDGFVIDGEQQKDGAIRIMLYSSKGTMIYGDTGELFSIKLKTTADITTGDHRFEVKRIICAANATAEGRYEMPNDFGYIRVRDASANAINSAAAIENASSVYTLDGKRVNTMEKGKVYVVGGVKMIVK